ncbi:transforming growth factor beta-1 proprotein-like [Lepus europaeus]|uniref:transforming growth factor beta-1 proprotein-like n=1 Tax=Lepus europaeus TaxID=9983 RepID=UPI002B49674C|nr:transforming growth factor beta-1 proprotein-like [Lepus europaeus]
MLPSGMRLLLPLLWLLVLSPARPAAGMPSLNNNTEVELLRQQHNEAVHSMIQSPPSEEEVPEDVLTLNSKTNDQGSRESNKQEPKPKLGFFAGKELTGVPMLESDHESYQKFNVSQHSVYMLFNTSEVREVMPEPWLLSGAELRLQVLKTQQEQHVELYQKSSNDSWRYLSNRLLAPSNRSEWLSFDVTGVVQQWLSHKEEIEGFRLSAQRSSDNTDNVLHVKINGISSSGQGDNANIQNSYRPYLLLIVNPLDRIVPPDLSEMV